MVAATFRDYSSPFFKDSRFETSRFLTVNRFETSLYIKVLPKSHLYQNKGIMSDPKAVLERKKSVVSSGVSTAPVSWEDYKSRLSIFGWQRGTSYKWNTKVEFFTGSGEIEAFGELFFDNLATMLGVTGSAVGHIGYGLTGQSWQGGPDGYPMAVATAWEKIYYEWNIPACGLCLLFGNIYYAWLATRLATKENRTDVCAQPYGMNTTVIYIMLYAITYPALVAGLQRNIPSCHDDNSCTEAMINDAALKAATYGWEVSVTANFIVGLFECTGFFLGDLVRWLFPKAAVFIPLMGVGFVWLAFQYIDDIFQEPMMCFLPFMIIMTGFFGNVRYKIYKSITFPIALLAILSSSAFGWMGACKHSTKEIGYGYAGDTTSVAAQYNGAFADGTARKTCQGTDKALAKEAWKKYAGKGDVFGGFGKGLKGFTHDTVKDLVAQSLLYGAIGFLGTMADVESAELAGDSYPMAECLIVDGVGTMIGALAGGIYGTTMYIGHPVHKALGAKIGYSVLNGAIFFILFTSGIFASLYEVIPLCANGAILIFVGLLLGRQGFENTPRRHYPALLLGLMPFIANIMSLESRGNHSYNMGIQMMSAGGGTMAGIFICCISCFAIDRQFKKATVLSMIMSLLSLFGFFASHNDLIDVSTHVRGPRHETLGIFDASDDKNQGWRWSIGWIMCAFYFALHIPFQKPGGMIKMPIDDSDMDADPYDKDEVLDGK